jgi:hypothetical protein
MDLERRIEELDARLRVAEDQLEILRLLNRYGPLVDSGSAGEAADLWAADGAYDFSVAGGARRVDAPLGLTALYKSSTHVDLVAAGAAHLTGTPHITVHGDAAEVVGYSFVIRREGSQWTVWRAAINHWTLARTADGWRITERVNRTLDGSPESRDTMRKVMA